MTAGKDRPFLQSATTNNINTIDMVKKFYDIVPNDGGGVFEFGEWQLCPKCSGEGILYLVVQNYDTTAISINPTCDVCNGFKLIQRPLLTQTIDSGSNTVTNTEEK